MIEIRSYRRVFDLERRIYSIDRLRLNPGGVPVRGVAYFVVLLIACAIADAVPPISYVAGRLPWYLRDLVMPGVGAAALSAIRIEGRTFHLAACALARHRLGARRLAGARPCSPWGERWSPPELLMLPDGSDGRMRALRYTGPGAVLVCVEHHRASRGEEQGSAGLSRPGRRATLTVRPVRGQRPAAGSTPPHGQVIALAAGVRLLVRPRVPKVART